VRILNEEAHDLCVDGCSPLPSVDCAGSNSAQPAAAATEGHGGRAAASAPVDDSVRSTPNYAAREAVTPGCRVRGGGGGIWIGTGALVVLAIVLIVVFVH